MPLLTQNKRVDRVISTTELFSKYSHLKEHARIFRSKPLVSVDPKCLLYVQQREFAATTPADSSVSVIGSEDATTCHLVVLCHTGSGATCLAHLDGSSTRTEVPLLVNAVVTLSNPSKAGRFELHLVGGFDDEKKTSHKLSREILAAFQKQKEEIHLETCCITEMNDVVTDGIHRPIIYGIGVNVKTGEIFPARFPHKEPAEDLRSARSFTGGQIVNVYDSSKEQMKIGPCRWQPSTDIAFWLDEDDETILQYLSTSPYAEPPHFVQHIKSTIRFLLEHPSTDNLFPGAIWTKMPLESEEPQKAILQKGGQNSVLERVKEDEDMFRHRIESLPGNRPNMKKDNRNSGDLKECRETPLPLRLTPTSTKL